MKPFMKFPGILVSIILLILYSCAKKQELDITKVRIPSYYQECSYKVYIKGIGFDPSWNSNVGDIHFYKDTQSNNFFAIEDGPKAIMAFPKNERLKVFKVEAVESEQLFGHGLLNGIEYYNAKSCDTVMKRTICGVTTHLLSFTDSTHVIVSFASAEGWKNRKDYDKIVHILIENH